MAITRAQQARQLYKNGKRVGLKGGGQDMGGGSSGVGGQSPGPGGGEGKGGRGGSNTGGGKGGGKGDADSNNPRREGAGPFKDTQKPKRKPKKTKKNTAPTLNFFERFRLAGLKNLYDQKSGNKKPGIGFSNLLNYANPSLDFYESTSDTDIMDTGYGLSGKNLTDMDRLADAINLGEKTGNLNQRQFEEAFYGPEGNKFIPSEIGENDIYIPPTIEEKEEEKEEDVPIAYRFMADGGRAAFQEGGGIFPRIDKLGNKVSSAEQELAAINSRLDTAQSSLGGQGGQNGGGIMNNSILPNSPFPSMDEPVEEGDMNNSILPDSPFPDAAITNDTPATPDFSFQTTDTVQTNNENMGGGRVPGGGPTPPQTLPDGTVYNPGRPMPFSNGISGGGPTPPQLSNSQIDGTNSIPRPGIDLQTLPPTSGELQPLPGFNNRRPMPFELQGPGTGNAPPMTQLGQYTKPTENQFQPLPPGLSGPINQGSGLNLGGGQLLNAGPRIPQPTITPGPNLQASPLQTAISGGGLASLGYGKPANMMSPAVGDPRTGAQQIDGNLAQMMMRGGFAEGGMPEYEGGIMDLESGRQQYFLGKLVKKAARAVKKVAKSPFGKVALLGLGAGMAGFGPAAGLFGGGKGLAFKQMLLGGKTLPPNMSFKSKGLFGGVIDYAKSNPLKTIAAASGLAGLMTSKEEDNELDRGEGIDIEAIRNSPYRYLAPRFMAEGGRIGYAEGSKEPVAKETMPLLDMDNQEMDLRQEGGFVPIGRMEKADDVPARLSKNEFVFTADAVRNAGEGNIDKGAEVMYNMMKNLESGGEVSEESQGLDGAREMFQTSQRLEEVL